MNNKRKKKKIGKRKIINLMSLKGQGMKTKVHNAHENICCASYFKTGTKIREMFECFFLKHEIS
jgi:hypothetical protein